MTIPVAVPNLISRAVVNRIEGLGCKGLFITALKVCKGLFITGLKGCLTTGIKLSLAKRTHCTKRPFPPSPLPNSVLPPRLPPLPSPLIGWGELSWHLLANGRRLLLPLPPFRPPRPSCFGGPAPRGQHRNPNASPWGRQPGVSIVWEFWFSRLLGFGFSVQGSVFRISGSRFKGLVGRYWGVGFRV